MAWCHHSALVPWMSLGCPSWLLSPPQFSPHHCHDPMADPGPTRESQSLAPSLSHHSSASSSAGEENHLGGAVWSQPGQRPGEVLVSLGPACLRCPHHSPNTPPQASSEWAELVAWVQRDRERGEVPVQVSLPPLKWGVPPSAAELECGGTSGLCHQ